MVDFSISSITRGLGDLATGAADATKDAAFRMSNLATGITVDDNTLGQSKYNFESLVFPEDLTSSQQGHYMVININVPVNASGQQRSSLRTESILVPNEYSKVDVLRFGSGGGGSTGGQREAFSLPRNTRRIAESIAIFMPNQVAHVQQHVFSDVKLTAVAAGLIGGWASVDALSFNLPQLLGHPINPRVEVLYANTDLRTFKFQFRFAPASENESINMMKIIRVLRYYAAPELNTQTAGMTFIPPADFDITFYNRGLENTNIPRINTCVLESIEVDYTPQGEWATFSNGHPVQALLTMQMKEVEILHKKRIQQGF